MPLLFIQGKFLSADRLNLAEPLVLRERLELSAQFADDFFESFWIENTSCFRQRAERGPISSSALLRR